MSKIDLSRLKWTKNVNNPDVWVYRHDEIGYPSLVPEFKLHWNTKHDANFRKLQEGDLLLLRQRTKVTHLVKVLDDQIHDDPNHPDFALTRRVQVLWIAPESLHTPDAHIWDNAPSQDDVFGFDLNLRGGKAIELDHIQNLNEEFKDQGGLAAFQKRVAEKLGLKVEV
ncbi:hypothetical protein [Pseudanabaena sp. Chao 1811]|uniref:hypothetical protein n=1 Tax=Pseudanabaena sp. Chao 1811 TaxID=2963092 RepID=UPI0022F3819E|nr:hypothetical protein [Pseudanabaena sp. Chao 1811]